jgi:hypothetical protein
MGRPTKRTNTVAPPPPEEGDEPALVQDQQAALREALEIALRITPAQLRSLRLAYGADSRKIRTAPHG